MIQAGLKTIDLLEREAQKSPEQSENITDFLRMLAAGRYKSVTILGINDMYFVLAALLTGIETITWYSDNDSLDNYLTEPKHTRVIGDANKVFIPNTEFLVCSMNTAMKTSFPERWMQRHLSRVSKKALVINSLVSFDSTGQSHSSKEVFSKVIEQNKNIFVLERQQSRSFGWSELKNKTPKK